MKVIIKNSNLVFQRKHEPVLVYKNYWVRGEGQYIDLSDVNNVKALTFDNFKVEAEIYIGKTTFTARNNVVCSRSSNCSLCTNIANGYNRLIWTNSAYTNSNTNLLSPSIGDYLVVADNKLGTCVVNNESLPAFTPPGSSALSDLWMFASGSQHSPVADAYDEGAVKVKRVKVYNATTGDLVIDIRPALLDNVPILYDSVTGTALYSEDGTALVVE